MFRDDALGHQEDLVWMPFKCFEFYVEPYIEYLRSDNVIGASDGANGFFSMTHARMHEIRKLKTPLKARIVDTLAYLGSRQEWFDAEPTDDGSFREIADSLLHELARDQDNPSR